MERRVRRKAHARCEVGENPAITSKDYLSLLFTYTKMQNIPGITTTDAKKTSDMYEKCQYLNEINHGKCGIVFATGTPVSNSMTELYTMQRYLQPERLKSEGLHFFDSWAANFGEVVTAVELAPEGKGFRTKTRFAKFHNLPELMSMFKEIADIKMADQLDLDVPEAEFVVAKMQPSEAQENMVDQLTERARLIRDRRVEPEEDNMLKVINDGRKLALDQRLIDQELPDDPNSKVNNCVKNVLEVYENTKEQKSTQMIFCDLSTPSKEFNVYDDIKNKLVAAGVKPEEVTFIQHAKNEKEKDALFEKVRCGEVRVLLGSTVMMGTGTNVQDRLIALHDLDTPWRPSDLEQRAGRIIRQGNENKHVKIFRYVTENTLDAYLYQILENKQRFISQIMTSKSPVRSAEDVDEATLSYAEIKAIATGNPLIKEKMDIDVKLERLKMAKAEYLKSHEHLDRMVKISYPQHLQSLEKNLANLRQDWETVKAHTHVNEKGEEKFELELGGRSFTDKKAFTDYLADHLKNKGALVGLKGAYKGLKLQFAYNSSMDKYEVSLLGATRIEKNSSLIPGDNLNRIESLAASYEERVNKQEQELRDLQARIKAAQEELSAPFPQEAEYVELTHRSLEIANQLNEDADEKAQEQARVTEEKEKRLYAIFESDEEPPSPCEKRFFDIVRHTLKGYPGEEWSPKAESAAVKALMDAGFSKDNVMNTLFKHSPLVPTREDVQHIIDDCTKLAAAR